MVHFKIVKGIIYGYEGDTFKGRVCKVGNETPEKLNYFRRKWEGKLDGKR